MLPSEKECCMLLSRNSRQTQAEVQKNSVNNRNINKRGLIIASDLFYAK
jgi:hypothetical protein